MIIALFVAGLLLVAVLTTAATAVRSVSRIWLRHWVEERLAGGTAETTALDEVQRLLLAASTAVALVAFSTGAVVGTLRAESLRDVFERLGIAAVLVLFVGQLIPRAIGKRWSTSLVPVLVPGLRAISVLLTPFVAAAQAAATRARPKTAETALVPDDRDALRDLLREGELEGVGDAGESAIISGVVDFAEKRARDVMTPRAEIFFVEQSRSIIEITKEIAQVKYTRVPVVAGGIDHVVGMYHAFDVLKWESGPPPQLRPVIYARDTTVASELLFRLLREGIYLAIVQDAAGKTVGVASAEDFLEELVGDIRDEHDEPAPSSPA